MTITSTVPAAAHAVRSDWDRLCSDTTDPMPFDPGMVAGLPEPARRWLTHSIDFCTPLWRHVELTMHGQLKLGAWRPFTARQVLAPQEGFIWAATARFAGIPVTGFDRYSGGTGQMRWRLLGLVPVMTGAGADVTRSAAGRLAAEGVLLPTCFAGAQWSEGPAADTVIGTWRVGEQQKDVTLHVGPDGRLLDVHLQRWGNPDGEPYGRYPFGVTVESEQTFAGVWIPSEFRAGWWWGTERQEQGMFFRARITGASFG